MSGQTGKVDVKCGFLCNNRCLFCVQGDKRSVYGDIPFHELTQTLENARAASDNIVFTGGEVTIKKEFPLLVRIARELGFKLIQVQTNGRMFCDENFCAEIISAGANDFSLALHGHTPHLHDYLTQAHGSFFQTVEGIRNLKKRAQRVGTNTVITRSNFRHLPAIARLLVHLGVDQYQLAFVHAVGTAGKHFRQIVPRYSLVEPYVKSGLGVGARKGTFVMTEAIPYCFMTGYHRYIAENRIPRTKIFDVKVIEDYTDYRVTEGKSKGTGCKECMHDPVCEGPWKEYPETYGWEEFIPVRSNGFDRDTGSNHASD